MPDRTDGKKNGDQTWIDYLTYERGETMVSIVQAKQTRKKTVADHLIASHDEKLEAMSLSLVGAGAMLGGVILGAVPLAVTGAISMALSGFATTNRNNAQKFAQKEAEFLKHNDNFLLMLASLEQKGEIPTLTAADMYNDGFARCTEQGGPVMVVDQRMFKEILGNHVNGFIAGTQATTEFAKSMETQTPMELPQAEPEAWEPEPEAAWEPANVPSQPYKYDLLNPASQPAIDVHSVTAPPAPAIDRLDPAQILRDVAAGAVAGPVLGGGYPQPPIGVNMVSPSALNDVNKYPFVMVVAGQGNGKSVTMAEIMTQLQGNKALSTPKADDHKNTALSQVYSLRFGFNPMTRQGQQFGDVLALDYAANDLDELLAMGGQDAGTILEFTRAAQMTANNRNARGKRSTDQPWRLFYDEAAQTYSVGFLQLGKKQEDLCKLQLEAMLKYGLFNFRGSGIQLFIGCQSETVDTIGMKNVSAARDEAWHLYPGRVAIEKARILNQPSIAAYLEKLLQAGYAIALLEKQGVIFEVLQLPKLSDLKKYDPIVDADEQPQTVHTAPTVIEAPVTQPPAQVIPQGEQMAQMLQAMVASGMIPDPNAQPVQQNDFAAMFKEMQTMNAAAISKAEKAEEDARRARMELKQMKTQLADLDLAARQAEIEIDEEYGAIDPDYRQPEMGPERFDPIRVLEDTLNGLRQEAELAGKSDQPVVLTTRDFSRGMAVTGTEYDGNKPGGAAKVRELFSQYAFSRPDTYRLSVVNEGAQNESWRLTSISPAIKSTATKAIRVGKRR